MATVYLYECDGCSFAETYKSTALGDYHFGKHSCQRWNERDAAKARGIARRSSYDKTPKPCLHKRADHQHGTYACYVLDKCRCDPCRKANSDYERIRNRRNAYGRSNLVDAGPAREHLAWLQGQGMGYKKVAAAAGVAVNAVSGLIYGKRGKPVERVTRRTSEAILGVRPELHLMGQRVAIDSTGTVRRLRALVACGWSMRKLGAEMGWNQANIAKFISTGTLNKGGTSPRTALLVRQIYDRLWDVPPPNETWHEKASVTRSLNLAQKRGWLPPVWWDEDTIDDPDYHPETAEERLRGQTNEVRVENAEFLREQGVPLVTILAQLECGWEALRMSYRRTDTTWRWSEHKSEKRSA